MHQEIIFRGKAYLLISIDDGKSGAIATKKQFETGALPHAYLLPDGCIIRHREQIGTRDDITFTGREIEATIEGEDAWEQLWRNLESLFL